MSTWFLFILTAGLSVSTNISWSQPTWKKQVLRYVQSLAKPDGGYGWKNQYDSHLTPTFAVIGILNAIQELPKSKLQLITFVKNHHPQKGTNKEAGPSGTQLRNLTYQQLQSIVWLGGDVSSFGEEVNGWKSQAGLLANYESHHFPVLMQEMMTPICKALLKSDGNDAQGLANYLSHHQRQNGSFNNAPESFGGDGNILNTFWAVKALQSSGIEIAHKTELIKWVKACQQPGGGFTHQPNPEIGVNSSAIYTWAAVNILRALNASTTDISGCVQYLISLRNSDGGFGGRPKQGSDPMATFYAVDALAALNAFTELDKKPVPNMQIKTPVDFTGYHVFSAQFQAHGNGSPAEAVALADSLHIHLWGVKYAAEGWVDEAQRLADSVGVKVRFFVANEPHDNSLIVPGMGSFNHVLDYFSPAHAIIDFKDSTTITDFKTTTLQGLKKVNGGLVLQVSNNEPLARMLLDESINNGFYKAITTIHFGQNFAFWLPYIMEYSDPLPLITLQDAHGLEAWWWAQELTNHRTLFVAKEPMYEGLVEALNKNDVVAVRHDSITNYKTRMLGGSAEARTFIDKKQSEWQWWDSRGKTKKPCATITLLTPQSKFETGIPHQGLAIRIRTEWNSIRNTLVSPLYKLIKLEVDGKEVKTDFVTSPAKGGNFSDAYHIYYTPDLKGNHLVKATVENIRDHNLQTISKRFNQE